MGSSPSALNEARELYAQRVMAQKTDEDRQRFLDEYALDGIKTAACKRAGVTFNTMQVWMKDAQFAEAMANAYEEAMDSLELEAVRRAKDGIEVTRVVGRGDDRETIIEKRYSDTLMIHLLKGGRPDKYADRSKSELSGPGGKPIETSDTAIAARMAAIFDAARRRREAEADDPLR